MLSCRQILGMEQIKEQLRKRLNLSPRITDAVIRLFGEGATVPFIARYRKEATGGLDEMVLSDFKSELKSLNDLEKRKETIFASLEEQGIKQPGLLQKIKSTWDSKELEDLYLPYKPKRKTRASMAKAKGLEPLAKILMSQHERQPERAASRFLNKDVPDTESALAGARDIIAEWIAENAVARNTLRQSFERYAFLVSSLVKKKKDEAGKYRDYFDFSESLNRCPSHRVLAILRAEKEGFLKVGLELDNEKALYRLGRIFLKNNGRSTEQVELALTDSYKRLLFPSIENEFKRLAKEKADAEAINVFSGNLRQLLMAAPLGSKRILAVDPGFRTGCKVVCLDENGNYVSNTTIFPHPPQNRSAEASDKMWSLMEKQKIQAVAIGNGTAGRETERFFQNLLKGTDTEIFSVNEAGASIYSASEVARDEFPDMDLTVRGAVSIGRRLMDPLAELVKIDPKSIGVGQYQHDVDQGKLKDRLDEVVMSVVNGVGVNLNTATPHLLRYVSGIGPKLASNIVEYRKVNGAFSSRSELKKVKGLGAKAFEQSAGFLRIKEGSNPLDDSAVHPESYSIVKKMAKDLKQEVKSLVKDPSVKSKVNLKDYVTDKAGLPTLRDIIEELEKPGLDPRGEAEVFKFAEGIHKMEDLQEGMTLPGIVTNLTKFGAFVDIGIKENGLVHISQITDRFIKDPAEVLKLGQHVNARVVGIDFERGRVSLSLK